MQSVDLCFNILLSGSIAMVSFALEANVRETGYNNENSVNKIL
jgi:hypothetical protein